jgi:hypothetical protein
MSFRPLWSKLFEPCERSGRDEREKPVANLPHNGALRLASSGKGARGGTMMRIYGRLRLPQASLKVI